MVGTLRPSLLPAGFQQERKQSWSCVCRMKAGAPPSPEAPEGRAEGQGRAGGAGGRVRVISGETSGPKLRLKKIKGAI